MSRPVCPRAPRTIVLAALIALVFAATSAAQSQPVRARLGMVVSQNEMASAIGRDVLKDGGNAVDAAVATAFALAVVHPTAGNIGGGGFMLFRPATGEPVAYDFREMAPAKASPTMFLKDGKYDATLHHNSSPLGWRARHGRRSARGLEGARKTAVEAPRGTGDRACARRVHDQPRRWRGRSRRC